MARVNVEEGAFGDARLIRLARKMGWTIPQAMGHLVMLWHESQAKFATQGTDDEIAAWGWCDESPETATKWVRALASIGYTVEGDEPNRWAIRGNAQQLEGLVVAGERAKKGGEANRRKWAERRAAESLELSPRKRPAIPGVAQCKAMQGNARQGNARHTLYPPSPSDLAVAREWLDFATNQTPSLIGRPGMTVEAFAEACRKARGAANLADDGLAHVLAFVKADDFWRQNALSPAGLLAKSKNGVRKIDNILSRMKTTNKSDRERDALQKWAES